MFKKSEKGFTLIELLVVVAIIGILAGVVAPRVMGALENARRASNIANRAVLQSAADRFFIDTQGWPVAGAGVALPAAGAFLAVDVADLSGYIAGDVLPAVLVADMTPGATGGDAIDTHTWAIDENGIVVLIDGTTLIWRP